MKKIAMVCQRYGLEVNGGAELHCRQLAEKLTARYDVEVLTSCAMDYMTWSNEYPAGESMINGVRVIRFAAERERNIKRFNKLSEEVFCDTNHTDEQEREWIEEQGPYCPELIEFVEEHHADYHSVLFMTYLYYFSATCLPKGMKNALLIPTAHDEPPIYLRHYKSVFENVRGLIYNTHEEKALLEKMFDVKNTPSVMAGVGVDVPELDTSLTAGGLYGLDKYIVYAGRIDESKGCGRLFDYFQEYKKRNPGDLQLVLMGKAVMKVPKHRDIISLGFVSDEDKFIVMRDSVALVLASEFESLSMVVLESMILGRPVLVNGDCTVLKGHCLRSNAGLYFTAYFEFEMALNYLLGHPQEYAVMRENAKEYVNVNYRWDDITEKISQLIETTCGEDAV